MDTSPSIPRRGTANLTTRIASRSIAFAAVALMAVACGPGNDPGRAGNAAIDRGATLRIGIAGPPLTLDPAMVTTQGALPPTFLLYDRLTQLDDKMQPKPMLATSWKFSPDGSNLEFKLREGVTFHDGTPVDAAAVKATLKRNKTVAGSIVAPLLKSIKSIDVVNPTTVRLNLVRGRGAELPTILGYAGGEIISPKAISDGRDLAKAPGNAGSGPYVVADYQPSKSVTLTRAPGTHWDKDSGKPARIEILYSAQGSTRLNALRARQLDLVQLTGPDVETGKKVAKSSALKTSTVLIPTPYSMFVHGDKAPFTDPRVRQAISIAIDRGAISDQLLGGSCAPQVQPYPEGNWSHVDGLEGRFALDRAKAKQLLADAGASGLKFQLAFTAGSTFESIAQAIQAQLATVGVTVVLTPLPSAAAMASYKQGQYPAYLGSMPTDAEPAQLLQSTYFDGYGAAEGIGDTIAPIADQADDPSLPQHRRAALYQKIWTTSAEQASVIPICASSQLWVYSPKITEVDTMPWRWAGSIDARYLGVTH